MKMIKNKTFSVSYFLGRAFFLGFGFSLLFKLLDKDAWIASLLGVLLGSLFIWFFQKFKENHAFTNILQKSIFFLFNFFVFTQILFIFETFCSSFYLIKSPHIYILLPLIFIIYRITKNGFSTITKVSDVLLPISLLLVLFISLGLIKNMNFDYFLPVLTEDTFSILQGTIYFAIYSTAPFFLLWNEKTEKNLLKPYLLSSLTVFLAAIIITAVLGPNLTQIYRYPEYMTLKKIKLFNFVEKVENIVSITWIFDLFITLAVSGNNMKELLPKKWKNFSFIGLLLLLFGISLYCGMHYKDELWIYLYLPIILGVFMLLLILVGFIRKKKES